MFVTFNEWTQGRSIASLGTNAGAEELPFQTWAKFKEAYAPELIARAIDESAIAVRHCLDPFGGSGTTALACQFLGVHPTTVEVNPFLADLIEAKLVTYDADALARDFGEVSGSLAESGDEALKTLSYLPATFVEPGVKDRWIFDRSVASKIATLLTAIDQINDEKHRRLFRVLVGGILIGVSNVMVSGKGRRYRRGWRNQKRSRSCVEDAFFKVTSKAISEIHRYANRRKLSYELICGDSREKLNGGSWDLLISSPPYPNSFDYTDVYNVELWMLGYLRTFDSNRLLRQATLSSHVQASRLFSSTPKGSPQLDSTIAELSRAQSLLWDRRIPEMVGAYFADIMGIVDRIRCRLSSGGTAWLVVGDSCYAGVKIPTANIIAELASALGWGVKSLEPFRSMRLSAQQGGGSELAETLIVLDPNN